MPLFFENSGLFLLVYKSTRGVAGDEGIQLPEQSTVALTRILGQRIAIVREIVKERFNALFIEFFPVRTVAGPLQPVRVEDLLELMAYRNGEIRLAEVQSFGDQRESRIRDDGACAGEIGKESVERRFLVGDASLRSFAPEAIGNEATANGT